MVCTLMHKRLAVVVLEPDEATGSIQRIGSVLMPERLPVGARTFSGMADRAALNEWWADRSIPASRTGIRDALEALDIASTSLLPLRSYGLSLSDHYWICPQGVGFTWDQVNFFDNPFSADIGDVLASGMMERIGIPPPTFPIPLSGTTDGPTVCARILSPPAQNW